MLELEVKNLNKRFGGLHVLKDVTFGIKGAELIGLIGPNGAGKTTLTNILDGAIKPSSGTVYLNGQRIDQLPPFEVAKVGLGRTFQVTRSFRRMTVLENLYVPALAKHVSADKSEVRNKALEVLDFLTMNHLRNEYAQALSGGQQKLLELGRLLMLDPDIIICSFYVGCSIFGLVFDEGFIYCIHIFDIIVRPPLFILNSSEMKPSTM